MSKAINRRHPNFVHHLLRKLPFIMVAFKLTRDIRSVVRTKMREQMLTGLPILEVGLKSDPKVWMVEAKPPE